MSDLNDPIPQALRYLRRCVSENPAVVKTGTNATSVINIDSKILGTAETGPIGELTLDLDDGTSIVLTVERQRRS